MVTPAPAPYFSLNADCFLVTGAVNAAVYQLSSGEVYAIDRDGRAVLERIEQGLPIAEVYPYVRQAPDPSEILAFLGKLETLGVGRFDALPAQQTKIRLQPVPFALRRIWLELTVRCNLRCLHCYADTLSQHIASSISPGAWQAIIVEAAALGADWLQFIGGEPLLYGKQNLFSLIAQAKQSRYQVIEIFTNGTLLDEEYIDLFSECGVQVALSIYANTPKVHDRVTQSPGSFQRTISNAKKLRQKNVPIRFGFVTMLHNHLYEKETLAWMRKEFGPAPVSCDVVRCTTGGRDQPMALLTPELWRRKLRTGPVFPQLEGDRYARSRSGHPCLLGQLCVQADGNVYPCIMDRTHVLGNVTGSSLASIVDGPAAREVWGLSKDRLPVCRDCEYRYACMDCRPLAVHLAEALDNSCQGLFAKDPCCLYDPYSGAWGSAEVFMEQLAVKGLLQVPFTE